MPEDGHCEHSEFSEDAESNSQAQGRFWNQPLGAAMGAGPPRDGSRWGKRAVPNSFPLKYGMWRSLYRILGLANLSHLSWLLSSSHYTPAYLQKMGNWGATLAFQSININVSELLYCIMPSPKHWRVTGRKHYLCPRVLSSCTTFKAKGHAKYQQEN